MTKPTDRRATNVSLPADMVREARILGINLSRACESGVQAALEAERERLWKIENAAGIAACTEWVEQNGLPLDDYRQYWPGSPFIPVPSVRRASWWTCSPGF